MAKIDRKRVAIKKKKRYESVLNILFEYRIQYFT